MLNFTFALADPVLEIGLLADPVLEFGLLADPVLEFFSKTLKFRGQMPNRFRSP